MKKNGTQRELKPEFTREDLGKNSFITNLKVRVFVNGKSDDKFINDGDVWMKSDIEFEKDPYTKVFIDAERRKDMTELSARAKDMLMWIMYEVDRNKDYFWLNKQRYMSENRVSSLTTYRAALNEVIKAGFIGKTVKGDVYWLNPHYFFCGNRIKCFPDNVVKTSK